LIRTCKIAVCAHVQYKSGRKQPRTTGARSGGLKLQCTIRNCHIFRQPDVSRNALRFILMCFFLPDSYTSTPAQWPPIKCIPQVRCQSIVDTPTQYSPHPSPNYYRGSKSANLASISTPLFFLPPSFQNEVNISLPKFRSWCVDDGTLFCPNLVEFGPPSFEE